MDSEVTFPSDFKKARRRKARLADPTKLDRLPPHSTEAEQCVLGCILLSPGFCLLECVRYKITESVFYDLRHQIIYAAMLNCLEGIGESFDVISLRQHLKDARKLEEAGGLAYLASLPDMVPSAANLDYYIEIVREKFVLRQMIVTCTEIVSRAYEHQDEVDTLLDEVERDILNLSMVRSFTEISKRSTLIDLERIDLTNFRDTLLGNDWLEKGSSCLISAPSGIGKSVLEIQMAIMFALDREFMGIRPTRPLKSVIIYAENSDRDNARAAISVVRRLELSAKEKDVVANNVVFRECYSASGDSFVKLARQIAQQEKPDLIWLDPLAAYAGDDISKQTVIASFLREGLHPIAKDHGFAWMIINHFTKPSGDGGKARKGWTASDHQYRGAGSYDLTGWTRAGIVISEHASGVFQFRFAKRGKLAGATHPNGEPTTLVWAQHAQEGIFWEQIDPPEEKSEDKAKGGRPNMKQKLIEFGLAPVLDRLAEPVSRKELARRIKAYAESKMDVSLRTCEDAIAQLLENGAVKLSGGLYFKP